MKSFYILLFFICIAFTSVNATFQPVCPENCPEDDFKRSHPPNIQAENIKLSAANVKIRIAFVFAGTPRSLVLPPVHESIRENLIASFCPPEFCISDVFARVSPSDNTHEGLDSFGVLKRGDTSLLPKITAGLLRLNPQLDPTGDAVVDIDWVDIGSAREKQDMLSSPFSSQRHKVLRALDPRRYSMYFNRWSAYQMALKREKETGQKYLWVVHARLDTVWGEPVRGARDWSSEYLYTPDTWWSDVPDTFAIVPRKFSDQFYGLESLVDPTAMCLGGNFLLIYICNFHVLSNLLLIYICKLHWNGGPNFDPLLMQEENLRRLGFDASDMKLANSSLCLAVFKGGPITFQKHPTLGR